MTTSAVGARGARRRAGPRRPRRWRRPAPRVPGSPRSGRSCRAGPSGCRRSRRPRRPPARRTPARSRASRSPIATRSLKAMTPVGRSPAGRDEQPGRRSGPSASVGTTAHHVDRPSRSRAAPWPRGSPGGAPGRCSRAARRRTRCAGAPATPGGRRPPRAPGRRRRSTPVDTRHAGAARRPRSGSAPPRAVRSASVICGPSSTNASQRKSSSVSAARCSSVRARRGAEHEVEAAVGRGAVERPHAARRGRGCSRRAARRAGACGAGPAGSPCGRAR